MSATLAILGGGGGTRMGGNKLFLKNQGGLVLEQTLARLCPVFSHTIISICAGESEARTELVKSAAAPHRASIVCDTRRSIGPMEGLVRCLEASPNDWVFAVGCDMLSVQEEVVRLMWRAAADDFCAVVARIGGYLEPLHAFYRKSCAPLLEQGIRNGHRHIKFFYKDVDIKIIEEPEMKHLPCYKRSFANINTPRQMREIAM